MDEFTSYSEYCAWVREHGTCLCGRPRAGGSVAGAKVYCKEHFELKAELQSDAPVKSAEGLALWFINNHLMGSAAHGCANCLASCPQDDYLCGACRA